MGGLTPGMQNLMSYQSMSQIMADPYGAQLMADPYGIGMMPQPPMTPTSMSAGNICMVYNLNPTDVNLQHLFNIFSVYGYIDKIKILHKKPDSAMIQFRLPDYADLALKFLNGIEFFKTNITVQRSKATELKLEDGSTNTKEYQGRDQRWPANAHDKIIRSACAPSTTLQLSFLDPSVTEEDVKELFSKIASIISFEFIPTQGPKFNMALMEVESINEGIQCVAQLHAKEVKGMTIKVNFTRSGKEPITPHHQQSTTSEH